jgi:hypothetical protein
MKKTRSAVKAFYICNWRIAAFYIDDKYMKKMHFSLKGLNYIQFKDILAKTSFNKKCPQLWKI